jgi:hypothetical protein
LKAREYVALFRRWKAEQVKVSAIELYDHVPPEEDRAADDLDLVTALCAKLSREVKPLAEARNATSPEAMVAIMLELQQRWDAVVRQLSATVPFAIREAFGLYLEASQNKDGIVKCLLNGQQEMLEASAIETRFKGRKVRR